ncbi:A.superbus venom factor 1 [Xenopus laevis]|uniref:A.superbus venom factor 1 n=1 Tax=Xenopus laevis TaxID=8355 RepID=A0A8J1MSQ9_XENLA|nr:A.superbus venom factor 1 [Xenopus laevis]
MGYRTLCLVLLLAVAGSYAQQCTLITASLLRVETDETIVVDAQGHNSPFDANIYIKDFPQKKLNLATAKVSLNKNNEFLGTATVKIPSDQLPKDTRNNQFVYVVVSSNSCTLEKVVMLQYSSGYIFIQTDKTIYTPGSKVMYRVFSLDYKMKPIIKPLVIEFVNPEGIIVVRNFIQPATKSGILSETYNVPQLVSTGIWTISAKYQATPNQNYTTNFEVKEYVLPTIEVILKPESTFYYTSSDSFSVTIEAQYLFGKPVEGHAFVLFGLQSDDTKKGIRESLERVQINEGEGRAELKAIHIRKSFSLAEMLKYKLYVTVSVYTATGSDMAEAHLENIHIVTSPYKILFTKTAQYFKPGLSYDVTVFVTDPDGSPASKVPVVVQPGKHRGETQDDGTIRLTLNTDAVKSRMEISVTTDKKDVEPQHQATASMVVKAYKPSPGSGNYLHISIPGSELKLRDTLAVNFYIKNNAPVQFQHFTYLIMSRGRIMKVGRQERLSNQPVVAMALSITEDYLPSFRIVAYYMVTTNGRTEIVSDSVWVDVVDTCIGTLELKGYKDKDKAVQKLPATVQLELRADHKATVGLVIVDKGVFVLNKKFKLTQRKVWNSVEKSDIGCTAGSGANSAGVFYDAGLALQTSFSITTHQRIEPQCKPAAQRKRRSTTALMEIKSGKASNYKDKAKKCCLDGMQENLMGHSCDRRARYILDGKECVDAFLDCCKYYEKKREDERKSKDEDTLERSEEESDYMLESEIDIRSDFPESWLWIEKEMTGVPDKDKISKKILNVNLKDSITTWEVLAVSYSDKGLCVAPPHEIKAIKEFFIDLKLPYSVVRNEQVEIRAIIYNYNSNRIKVQVQFNYNKEFCSLSTPKKKFQQEVWVGAESSVVVPFIIVPLTIGEHDVEVTAMVYKQFVSDGVLKKLRVVSEGMLVSKTLTTVILEPELLGKDVWQEVKIGALIAPNIVPKSDIDIKVILQGTPISQLVENAIDGSRLHHLIQMPDGCGEQNMMRMTTNVITTRYLDATGQWERVGVDRREKALNNIKDGYQKELAFRKSDLSFSAFQERPSSTWLTAYVAKVFAMSKEYTYIDDNVLCGAIKWLILETQMPDGMFIEKGPVIHMEMVGGNKKGAAEPDAALTAFVLISMLESRDICTPHLTSLGDHINRAVNFLWARYSQLRKPYSIAITSYALALAGKLQDTQILQKAATDKSHWEEPHAFFISLEATSYALLTLLKLKEHDPTRAIVRWLNEKRYYGAVFDSTQATIIMFQALAQYQLDVPHVSDLSMDVSIYLPEKKNPSDIRIDNENAMMPRSEETTINQDFVIKAKGPGQVLLTVVSVYHSIEIEKQMTCQNFDVSVKVNEEKDVKVPNGAVAAVSIEVCARFLKDSDATMSIIDISMMTGFYPDTDSLNKLKDGVDKYISKYEINKGANEKGTLILYVDKISNTEPECIKFYAHQYFEMGLVQPASVTVYDYYTPENRCTKFYHINESSALYGKLCLGELCRCAEENCFLRQTIDKQYTAEMRSKMACAPGVDYVYKANVKEVQHKESYDNYVMTIVKVIKQGTDEFGEDNERNFISHIKCRKALDLMVGRDYLIWGITGDVWKQPNGYAYIIGKDTWIEWWPTERDCQKRENQNICDIFDDLSGYLEIAGCQN